MEKRSLLLVLLVIVLFVSAFFYMGRDKEVLLDERAPGLLSMEMELFSEDKGWQSLSSLIEGQPFALLSFWATWCAPCVEELPLIYQEEKNLELKGVKVLYLNFDNGTLQEPARRKVNQWLEENEIKIQSVFDPKEKFLQHFSVSALPFNAVVDAKGNVLMAQYGEIDFDSVAAALKKASLSRQEQTL